jgi:hypothetical protein
MNGRLGRMLRQLTHTLQSSTACRTNNENIFSLFFHDGRHYKKGSSVSYLFLELCARRHKRKVRLFHELPRSVEEKNRRSSDFEKFI